MLLQQVPMMQPAVHYMPHPAEKARNKAKHELIASCRRPQSQVDMYPTAAELRKATAKMKSRAPGLDGWSAAMLLRPQASASLWKAVIHFGDVPRAWQRRATVVLLPKDQEDTRPMALLSMAWRSGARGHRPSRKELGGRLVRSQCVWICPWTIRVRNAPKNVLCLAPQG